MAPKTDVIEQLRTRIAELEAEVERLSAAHVKACQANADSQAELAAKQLNNKLLRDVLNQWIGIASNCSIESGCCGCGESIENHSHPMMCGHSPVDMAYSVVRKAIDSTDKALSLPASTEALDKYVAEKVTRPNFSQMREMLRAMQAGELTVSRGIEILDIWHAGNWNDDMLPPVRQDLIEEDSMPVEIIDRLTRQRDLAVDALEKANEGIKAEFSDNWTCSSYHPKLFAGEKAIDEAMSAIKESEAK